MKKLLYFGLFLGFISCNGGKKPEDGKGPDGPKSITYSIINTYPHDTSSFTEGLLIYKGEMYESTGNYGRSKLLKVDFKTGKILKSLELDKKYFGEGIAILRDTIYQLTYQENVGFMYAVKDFRKLGEFKFAAAEGWGMTSDSNRIIATDGTSNLYYYAPGTFKLLKTQAVTEGGSLAYNINEVEYIDGYIYANQWQAPYILKIEPSTGAIVAKADLSAIWNQVQKTDPNADVPNGIAYDPATKKMYITGKHWPDLYEIQLSQ